jgi:hypothetical protein
LSSSSSRSPRDVSAREASTSLNKLQQIRASLHASIDAQP